jgi:hypothetical protein
VYRGGGQKLLGAAAADAAQRLEGGAVDPLLGAVFELADGFGEAVEPEWLVRHPATAQALDAKLCPGQLPLVSYVARTVFLHSLAFGDAARGISSEQLRLSICSPLIEPAFIEQARMAFIAESLYLDDRPGAPLRFMTEPNLTMVIRREMDEVQLGRITDELGLAGTEGRFLTLSY